MEKWNNGMMEIEPGEILIYWEIEKLIATISGRHVCFFTIKARQ